MTFEQMFNQPHRILVHIVDCQTLFYELGFCFYPAQSRIFYDTEIVVLKIINNFYTRLQSFVP